MVCLMCAPFLFGDSIVVFPWKSIWFVKVLKRCHSFYGQQPGMGYLPLIILLREVNPMSIDVACVGVMENLWTISYFNVSRLMLCSAMFFMCLESIW